MRFRVKLEELNLTLNIKSEEITPPLNPFRQRCLLLFLLGVSARWTTRGACCDADACGGAGRLHA